MYYVTNHNQGYFFTYNSMCLHFTKPAFKDFYLRQILYLIFHIICMIIVMTD